MKLNNIYIISFKLNNKNKYIIWYTDINENDKFFNYKHKIKTFSSLTTVRQFIKKYSNESIEIIEYNLDLIILEIKNNKFNLTNILDFWNIMIDIFNTCNIAIKENDVHNKIYDKLFYGENLPTINNSNKKYIPIFTKQEKNMLKKLILNYINIVNKVIFNVK